MDVELRRRICRLIAGLVVADSDLAPEEDAFIDRMLATFGISDERESIFPILERDEAAAEMRELPPPEQEETLRLLLQAAAADGQVVEEERDYLRAVGAVMGVEGKDLEARIQAALAARSKA